MANTASTRKRARQNVVRRHRNSSARASIRTAVKRLIASIEEGNVENAREALVKSYSALDSGNKKGLIHKNTAARTKSRLNARVKAMGGGKAQAEQDGEAEAATQKKGKAASAKAPAAKEAKAPAAKKAADK